LDAHLIDEVLKKKRKGLSSVRKQMAGQKPKREKETGGEGKKKASGMTKASTTVRGDIRGTWEEREELYTSWQGQRPATARATIKRKGTFG